MDGNEEELLKEEGYAVMGAAFEVYNHLGPGFLEEVYHEAMEIEMTSRGISFVSKPKLQVIFKGLLLRKYYEADFLAYSEILVELKATRKRVGYLINFGAFSRLQWSRRVL